VSTFSPAQGTGAVVVYNCATGAALQRFTGDQFEATTAGGNYLTQNPVWSPDGSRLLLTISGPIAKLVILGPQSLGA
jgi:Tol biopolymer transport system component